MNEDTEAGALPEGEALPEHLPPPLPGSAVQLGDQANLNGQSAVLDAIERWYADHFHACAVAGRAPITADDKAALIASVREAVAQPQE